MYFYFEHAGSADGTDNAVKKLTEKKRINLPLFLQNFPLLYLGYQVPGVSLFYVI
jgi:hypothetical protein